MARKKKFKDVKIVNFKMELEQYEKLEKRVPSVSEFFRKTADHFLESSSNLHELEMQKEAMQMEMEELIFNIDVINEKIKEIKENQKKNDKNKEIKAHILEVIQTVIGNEYQGLGITKDRLDAINHNQISNIELQKLVSDNNIRVIGAGEKLTSRMIEPTPAPASSPAPAQTENDDDAITQLVVQFKQQLNKVNAQNPFTNFSAKEYLKQYEKQYQARCRKKDIDFTKFKESVLN